MQVFTVYNHLKYTSNTYTSSGLDSNQHRIHYEWNALPLSYRKLLYYVRAEGDSNPCYLRKWLSKPPHLTTLPSALSMLFARLGGESNPYLIFCRHSQYHYATQP